MYNDSVDYLRFLLQNNILISKENVGSDERLPIPVLNPNQDWDSINKEYNENKIVVIDNFLSEEFAHRLREFFLLINIREDIYSDYAAINFYRNMEGRLWFPILTNISEECKIFMSFLRDVEFERAWAFIYDNISNGVPAHADPASTNLNLWVTPDECMNLEDGKNGLDLWKMYPPDDWDYNKYNGDFEAIESLLSKHESEKVRVDYKFNRVTVFDSKFFHKTQPVSSKSGYTNRRINYTFLYR